MFFILYDENLGKIEEGERQRFPKVASFEQLFS